MGAPHTYLFPTLAVIAVAYLKLLISNPALSDARISGWLTRNSEGG